ncbi:rCG37635 [Rattus norvegicus]|uniref:RCG37635 n=1 Tax=Rattus norvegicus TaxID=10116 RepID=A6K802_RAT|nr:rCG37635 [Rattus norvegicus]
MSPPGTAISHLSQRKFKHTPKQLVHCGKGNSNGFLL